MRRAVEHLGQLGHEHITYVAGPEASWADGMRWRALREAGHELEIHTRRIGPFAPTVDGGREAARELGRLLPTAVIAYNDLMAIGVMLTFRKMGVGVPEEVSVIGFDNILPAELVSPGLTTVAAPFRPMGATAVSNLVAIIRGALHRTEGPFVLPTKLVVRESTARARRSASR